MRWYASDTAERVDPPVEQAMQKRNYAIRAALLDQFPASGHPLGHLLDFLLYGLDLYAIRHTLPLLSIKSK